MYLGGHSFTDIALIAAMTEHERLALLKTGLSDIAFVANLPRLKSLDLGGTGITDLGFLGAFTSLEQLWLWGNGISDISPLAGLTNLRFFDIPDNNISDISTLVANPGLGAGDEVNPMNNVLDLTPGSAARNSIQALLDRGVNVAFKPQRSP